jgi:hypothetical protein
LRESRCGLANLPEGSEEGLRRLTRGEVMAAAIHLHTLDSDEEQANLVAVAALAGLHDAVVIAFARREQGILGSVWQLYPFGGHYSSGQISKEHSSKTAIGCNTTTTSASPTTRSSPASSRRPAVPHL